MNEQEQEILQNENSIETIYINNLNEKVSLKKMKTTLENLFNQYGTIIQLTAHKNLNMRGQAFITYKSTKESLNALCNMNKYILFDKPMNVAFAKTKSDNYYLMVEKNDEKIKERKEKKKNNITNKKLKTNNNDQKTKINQKKKSKLVIWEKLPPNKILLLQNLSNEIKANKITEFFEKYNGFINIRFLETRNLSFIEFDNEKCSTECLKLTDPLNLKSYFGENSFFSYAKK